MNKTAHCSPNRFEATYATPSVYFRIYGTDSLRARGRSENPAVAAAAERRSAGRRNIVSPDLRRCDAAKRGGEALQRSIRSQGGGAWRRSLGMRPDPLPSIDDGLGKRLPACLLRIFHDDHVKRHKKHRICCLITSRKGPLSARIYLDRYSRDSVNRVLNRCARPHHRNLEAKPVSSDCGVTSGRSSQTDSGQKRIELDLDGRLKVNFGKLAAILTQVKGPNAGSPQIGRRR